MRKGLGIGDRDPYVESTSKLVAAKQKREAPSWGVVLNKKVIACLTGISRQLRPHII